MHHFQRQVLSNQSKQLRESRRSRREEKYGRGASLVSLLLVQDLRSGRNQNKFVFFMMRRNSSSFTSPSPSRSASSIISWSSSSVMRSPSSFATRFRFLNEIFPVSSSSNKRNALRISSLGSRLRILCVIIFRNSSYSIVPLPSSSTSDIIFWISSFLGSNPSARMATLSSLESIDPEPSVSKRSKASLISCFCSSVSSFCFLPPALKRRSAIF